MCNCAGGGGQEANNLVEVEQVNSENEIFSFCAATIGGTKGLMKSEIEAFCKPCKMMIHTCNTINLKYTIVGAIMS